MKVRIESRFPAPPVRLLIVSFVALAGLGLGSCEKSTVPPIPVAESTGSSQQLEPVLESVPDRPPSRSTMLPAPVGAVVDRLAAELPHRPESLVACGRILDLYGQSDEALWFWKKCLVLDPEFAPAHEQLGIVAMKRGDLEQAVERLHQATRLDPALPESKLHLGKALLNLGRYQEAIPILENQTSQQPKGTEAWFRLGQAHLELEDLARAKECYQSALDAYADCLPAWFGMAQVHDRLGEAEQARQCRERFVALDKSMNAFDRSQRRRSDFGRNHEAKELSQAYMIAAGAFDANRRSADAQQYWRMAGEADATNVACRRELARSFVQENRLEEAIQVAEELRRLEPGNAEHILGLATLYQQRQEFDGAERCFREVMEVAPKDPQGPLGLARLYLMTGKNLPEAQRLAERASQLQPVAENYFTLSLTCSANRDMAGARAALRQTLRLDPHNPQYVAASGALDKE